MDSNVNTVTLWQSGRLAPHIATRRFEFSRGHWLGAALLVLAAIVLALFVAVLEREVGRGEMQHAANRARASAAAQCEAERPSQARGRCSGLFDGNVVAAEVTPAATPDDALQEQDNDPRATTASLPTTAL